MSEDISFPCFVVIGSRGLSVEWEWIGEGDEGDYQDDDPEDMPRLRANLRLQDEELADGSYCTLATPFTPKSELAQAANALMASVEIFDSYRGTPTFNRRVMESWTWTNYSK